jgi:hypothetical protein
MVSRERVQEQLKRIGCNFRFWGRAEQDELSNVLMDSETIAQCVNGHYDGGFAMLCATDHRVLLIDKKPMNYLYVEDIRFEMISEFDYSHRLLNATVHICTPTKTLTFISWNQYQLRALLSYVQQRVVEIRQYYYLAQQFQGEAAKLVQTPQPTFIHNLAYQSAQPEQNASPAAGLGAFTAAHLPQFRQRNSKNLGTYAVKPNDILQAGDTAQQTLV